MRKSPGSLFAVALLVSPLLLAGSATAQTWVPVAMPNITPSVITEDLNTVAPFSLGIPTAAAPSLRAYLSNLENNTKGFRIRGSAIALGSGTDWNNHVAAFFHTQSNYTGPEYGLVMHLPEGKLRVYQCEFCNTPSQLWTSTIVYNTPKDFLSYQVYVNSDGSFNFKAVSPWPPYSILANVNVAKAAWMPNLYDTSGYLTITSQRVINDGGDWSPSTLHVDQIEVRR